MKIIYNKKPNPLKIRVPKNFDRTKPFTVEFVPIDNENTKVSPDIFRKLFKNVLIAKDNKKNV